MEVLQISLERLRCACIKYTIQARVSGVWSLEVVKESSLEKVCRESTSRQKRVVGRTPM